MNHEKEPAKHHDLFGQLKLSEEDRRKLADLARIGEISRGSTREATFISAQSDTLPLLRKEQDNA